jgi:PKD repeat protein
VASFTDLGSPDGSGAYSATINWGDGTSSAGTVGGAAGSFTVSGQHTYTDEGSFTVTTTVTETGIASGSASASASATVAEGDGLGGSSGTSTATEGSAFTGQFTFTDTNTSNTAADFTATIDWGDGTSSAGTVSGGSGSFMVTGKHTYADEGTSTATATLTDDAPGSATASATVAVTVAEGDGLAPGAIQPAAAPTEGIAYNGSVAAFTDTNTLNGAADFTATINWGDGTTTTGTVSGAGGFFIVTGSHNYADEGSFQVTTTMTDDSPGTASVAATNVITVADADTVVAAGAAVVATEGVAFSGTVATFSDAAFPGNPAVDFTATIDWGDGTSSVGTISGANGSYTITGSHTYADESPVFGLPLTVTIFDGSLQTRVVGTAFVLESPLPPGNPQGTHGTQAERWLSEIWQDLYGTPIDLASLRHWTRKLRHGTTRRQAAQLLITPTAFLRLRNRLFGPSVGSLTRAQRFQGYVLHFLDREPDAATVGRLLAATRGDSPSPFDREQDLVDMLIASAEYFNKVAL